MKSKRRRLDTHPNPLRNLGVHKARQPESMTDLTTPSSDYKKPENEFLDNIRRYDAAFEEYWQSRREAGTIG